QFGAALSLQGSSARILLAPVYIVHLAYSVVVWRTHPHFRLALALYVPSALFLRLALLSRLRVPAERRPATMALVALAASTAAGITQVGKLGLHPRWFDHNATFHLVQAIAFALLYPAARGLLKAADDTE
ncbi:MAG: hypothetical protein ACC726_08620, partial [Chloroflexota bacterium]